jgi:type I restriction-modification system DNA methylase subunit
MQNPKPIVIPEEIAQLVRTFDQHRDTYLSPKYNETQVRREFIDRLFGKKGLGWDIDNEDGYADAYKDVIHEDAIKIGGATKAPDYCFRIGGTRKFFLEAKKPSVNIKDDPDPAYQLRRYAWSAKLPLSILTDFEELAVYDTRVKPAQEDRAGTARVLYLRYDEFDRRWNEIASIFSRDAVLKGSFDKYAESNKQKKGTAEVDETFLEEIESWRDLLAKNIALRNPTLSVREMNYAVQVTIDRIVFLRMCEDRAIEPYGQLSDLVADSGIYRRLVKLFDRADEKYNSGLFHFQDEKNRSAAPDMLSPNLLVDDAPLKRIITRLYYPDSPYEFSVLPAEILGQVYEQFLGKVIRLTTGHRAVIEEKPEVRKAGGVYYTPSYIVDFIVNRTVGTLVKGKTPKQVARLRIVDPACGSGSFLIGAYQFLLDWHRDWYVNAGPNMHAKLLYQGAGGVWHLTTAEKKRILLNNIYGVDIDAQAVEVTKLSLLLKVLEGESGQSLERQLKLFGERALPDLEANIKFGNSLIGPEFYLDQQTSFLDEEERIRINAFDWKREFPGIFSGKEAGFDVVIGNPPYVNAWELYANMPHVRDFINTKSHYNTADRHWDLYVLFIERAIQILATGGRLSFIIPFSYAIQKYAISSRKMLLERLVLESIADLRTVRVFKSVPVITIIPVVEKSAPAKKHLVQIIRPSDDSTKTKVAEFIESHTVPQQLLYEQNECMLRLDITSEAAEMLQKIDRLSIKLGDLCYVNYGAQMSSKEKGKFGKEHVIRNSKVNADCRQMISGRELYRYSAQWGHQYVDWSFAPQMYGPRWPEFFEQPKLMIRDITGTHRIEATFDDSGLYCDHTVLCAQRKQDVAVWKRYPADELTLSSTYDLRFLTGAVASKAASAYYYLKLTGEGVRTGGGFHTYPDTVRKLPVPRLDFSVASHKQFHDQVVRLVGQMLELRSKYKAARTDNDRKLTQRSIETTDARIDTLFNEFYGLRKDEIEIIDRLAV